ncbi:MAG: glycosyltransferase family 2 protein [Defluviicoccus sp.]
MSVDLSVIVPLKNEEANLANLWARLEPVLRGLSMGFEVLLINDGSTDRTLDRALEIARVVPELKVIDLSRNFGKEAALACGFFHASGGAVVSMDGDLQHPPEMLAEMVARWREGYEMIYAVRRSREYQGALDRACTRVFYWLFEHFSVVKLPPEAGDFRLLDRKVVDALNALPERNRFMKGMYAWVGFRTLGVPFTVESRSGGTSKFSPLKKLGFAFDALTAFSNLPLRVWSVIGAAISLLAFFYIVVRLIRVMVYGLDVPGYESLLAVVLFLGGMQLLSLGILGDYLARVFEEAKGRPLYVVRERFGFTEDKQEGAPRRVRKVA